MPPIDRAEAFNPGASRNLDLLRAIAVGLVVQDHLFTYFGNPRYFTVIKPQMLGRYGVILFFVHTALVLMASMDRQWDRTGRRRFLEIFFIRRGFRIFPLALFALFATIVFHVPGIVSTGRLRTEDITQLRFLSNLTLTQNMVTGVSLLAPMWSLAYEWQMYLVLPAFYFLCRKSSTAAPLFAIWAVLALIASTYEGRIGRFNGAHAVWNIPNWEIYGPCFIAGILAYFTARKLNPRPVLPWFALPLGIAAMFLPMMETSDYRKFLPASLLIALLIPYCAEIKANWLSEAARIVVRYSYSIYLFHVFAIYVAFMRVHGDGTLLQWVVFWAFLAISSVAGFHLIEHPMIVAGNRIARRLERGAQPGAAAGALGGIETELPSSLEIEAEEHISVP